MKATEMKKLSIESAREEIHEIERKIKEAAKQSEKHIVLKKISEGAIAYFKENGFDIEISTVNIAHERVVVSRVLLSW